MVGPRRDSEDGAPPATSASPAPAGDDHSAPRAAGFLPALRQLWRHRYFRRLMAIRVATQTSDGVLQIALASYVLFSPERQPDAASVAAVLAVTLLPFSLIGPFVSVVLDRWSRRQVILVVDTSRAVLALALAALVATGLRTGPVEAVFYGGVLLAMSLNRFLLAGLSAALPHTIERGEYMVANSVVPTIGPAGALVGAAIGTSLRLLLGAHLPDYVANAAVFAVAALGFAVSATLSLRIPRRRLGPDELEPTSAGDVVHGLVAAVRHLVERRPAGLGLLTIGAQRIVYGVVTVATILVYRNYFHPVTEVEPAIADLGLLVGFTGAGFVLAAVVTPPMTARIGVRAWVISCLFGSALFQLVPGAIYTKVWLMVAAFLLGLTAQCVKICVDTLVQAHVDDDFKGRVFVIYDMIFNVVLVAAAGIAALIVPTNGKSVLVLAAMAGCYLLVGVWFTLVSRGLEMDAGTESMRSAG
ncbi:MFS transporter [Microlunatus ginsengisoli]|uniref:MFS transporter n=1 Tax=Microlunatus ginsengisoli TaxID=363863 RepID=A0ABP6ZZM2_9ACTN